MPTRPKKPEVQNKDYYHLVGPDKAPCEICERPTYKTIVNTYNRAKNLDVVVPESLDWEAIERYLAVIENRPILVIPNGQSLTDYNIYRGKAEEWKYGMNNPTTYWSGEDFSDKIPYWIFNYTTKARFKDRKNKKKALLKFISQRNEREKERAVVLHDLDLKVACCSSACLNMWLLRKDSYNG